MRYNLEFTIKLADKFIKNKEVDPRKYSRIRRCLCEWMRIKSYLINKTPIPSYGKSAKKNYSELSTALNKLDDYYMDRINYINLLYSKEN